MTNTPISRAYVSDIEIRADGTGRTIHGIVVPFGRVATVSDGGKPYQEAFQVGAFKRTIDHGVTDRVKLLGHHNRLNNPLGKASLLREDAAGLYGEFRVSQTTAGDEALELVRDGALDSFSVGFIPVQHQKRDGVVWRTEAGIREASLVTFPAYEGALVGGVRWDAFTEEQIELLRQFMAQAEELRSTTPEGDSEDAGTSNDLAHVEQDSAVSHSARHVKFNFSAELRKRGLRCE